MLIATFAPVAYVSNLIWNPIANKFFAKSSTNNTIDAFLSEPLIGAVLRENRDARSDLEQAITLDRADNSNARTRAWVADARRTYVNPAIMKASDKTVIDVWKTQLELVNHLNRTNTKLCKEFHITGFQNLNSIDKLSKDLFYEQLRKTEIAYKDGASKEETEKPLSAIEMANVFHKLELLPPEVRRLANSEPSSDEELCHLLAKLNNGILNQLDDGSGPRVMRLFLQGP